MLKRQPRTVGVAACGLSDPRPADGDLLRGVRRVSERRVSHQGADGDGPDDEPKGYERKTEHLVLHTVLRDKRWLVCFLFH